MNVIRCSFFIAIVFGLAANDSLNAAPPKLSMIAPSEAA